MYQAGVDADMFVMHFSTKMRYNIYQSDEEKGEMLAVLD